MRTVFNGSNTKLAVANMGELISALDERTISPFPLGKPHKPSPAAENRLRGASRCYRWCHSRTAGARLMCWTAWMR